MVRTRTREDKPSRKEIQERLDPSSSLLMSWAQRLSEGGCRVVPVYLDGGWTYQVVRGVRRSLNVSLS